MMHQAIDLSDLSMFELVSISFLVNMNFLAYDASVYCC